MQVVHLEPEHAMVWQILDPTTHQPARCDGSARALSAAGTWAFVLEPEGDHATRLIQRFRFDARPRRWGGVLYRALMEIPHFVMELGMLRGIKQRAERAWREAPSS
jgi:hypothetical protein